MLHEDKIFSIYLVWLMSLQYVFICKCSQLFCLWWPGRQLNHKALFLWPSDSFKKLGTFFFFFLKNKETLFLLGRIHWNDVAPLDVFDLFCILLLQPFNLRIFSEPPWEFFHYHYSRFSVWKLQDVGNRGEGMVEEDAS